ncbi:MAG: CoA-binding protein, partial [Candidatus Thermoplasmatota archaeon]|nr:CoA-binding protein [Candidatus Thermoplasmatota archaeon]
MLDPLFNPKSVAVIGASNKELTIGNRILKNLIDFKFKGELFPVHPKEELVRGLKAYKSILDIPQEVDLAHIVVKNTIVPSIVEECGKKGVKVVIINSAGFKEIGGEGIELERKIVEIGKKYGVRIFGPNCQGIMNTDKDVSVYANFTFTKIKPGNISILAQSGGVGEVINNRFSELGIGIRMYASNGNACDISLQEILKYWGKDEQTRVIVLHIESLNNPKEFMEIAADIARRKPILAMKSGRTEEGAKAITSHTGALVGKDTTTELIFDKCGIVSFRSIEELCDAAIAFVTQPLPKGPRVGVVTNTGGPGIIAADECIDAGLILPDLS